MQPQFRIAAPLLILLLALASIATRAQDVDAVPAGDSADLQLTAASERYRQLMDEGRNADAVAAGVELVNLTRQRYGDGSLELVSPFTKLATAQLRNGELREAEANYTTAITLLEKREGFLSPHLTDPLVGLGATYIRGEQYPQATETYERALRVNHVNDGFYNPEQNPIRDGLTEGYLGLRKIEKANFHQEAQVSAAQRTLGKDNPQMVAPLTKLGRWYDRSYQAESARLAYQTAARIVEKNGDENSPELVEPLLAIAETYRQQALLPPDPESSQAPETLLPTTSMMLRRALEIVEHQQPPDPEQRARILVKLGDLYLMWGKRNTASDRYLEAWQALSADGLQVRRDEYFAAPVRIMGPVPPAIFPVPSSKTGAPDPKSLEPGFVVVRFDVDRLGRVMDVTVVEADPANLLEKRVTDAARAAVFRPRYVDGAPVATTGLILRHAFRYAPAKLERKDEAPPESSDKRLDQPSSGEPGG